MAVLQHGGRRSLRPSDAASGRPRHGLTLLLLAAAVLPAGCGDAASPSVPRTPVRVAAAAQEPVTLLMEPSAPAATPGPRQLTSAGAVLPAATATPLRLPSPAPVGVAVPTSDPPPLFDGHGRPSAAARAAAPADPSLRTLAGLYASPAQYDHEALTSSPYTVLLDLDAAGWDAALDSALLADRFSDDAAAAMAYFVKASEPRSAVRLANALSARGFGNVFLLLPPAAAARSGAAGKVSAAATEAATPALPAR